VRLLCWLGFHAPVTMARLWLTNGWDAGSASWELRFLRCSRCGAPCEDEHGYENVSTRRLS
jgi:hypothetical protein